MPINILQKILSKRHFEIWERMHLETVCKLWKRLMLYDDFRLDVYRTCEGMSKLLEKLYNSKRCFPCNSKKGLYHFLHEMLIVRGMRHYLTQLVLIGHFYLFTRFDL